MPYKISFLRSGELVASKEWNGSLAGARAYAEELFATDPRLRIEIRNSRGDLLFYRPKIVDGGSSDDQAL